MTQADSTKSAHEERGNESTTAPTGVQPLQTDDTSGSADHHTAQREHLQRNVTEGQAERHPETPAGQHATGSFTGKTGGDADRKKP
jgi:hypothetical protein